MGIGAFAGRARSEDEELRLELFRPPRQLLDAHRLASQPQHGALVGRHHAVARDGLRTGQQVRQRGAIRGGQPLEGGHAGAGRAALDGRDEADRQARCGTGVPQAEPAPLAQASQQPPVDPAILVVRAGQAVAQHPADARRVEAVDLPHAPDASQVLEVGIGIEPIAPTAASRSHQPLALPQTQRGRGDADAPRGLADGDRLGAHRSIRVGVATS
jgi:hypothetical protein